MQSNLETHWLSHRYKSTHAEMNAEKSNKIKAVKKEKSNGNYPAVNSIAQMTYLVLDKRAAVAFGPRTRTLEGKLLSNLMKRVRKAQTKEN